MTFKQLDEEANAMTDLASAEKMHAAKKQLFDQIFSGEWEPDKEVEGDKK